MGIAAVKVMAAGKAGLEALPYFVKEFNAQGYRQLVPLGLDHINTEAVVTNSRIKEMAWMFGSNPEELIEVCEIIQPETNRTLALLNETHPTVKEKTVLADSPACIGAWCRALLKERCTRVLNEWTRYFNNNRSALDSHSDPLLVVIPYCPEGPTSGTIGMYLGAMLRDAFAQANKSNQLLVCGVELCPPTDSLPHEGLKPGESENVFRGYVARQEMDLGLPLTAQADDTEYWKCFDINIVFDGGAEVAQHDLSPGEVWPALDRVAAQATALLFKGAANNGDVMEAVQMLRRGRWEVGLAHLVSELRYNSAARIERYRSMLPWHKYQDSWWLKASPGLKKRMFIQAIEDMTEDLQQEVDPIIRGWFSEMQNPVNELKGSDIGGLTGVFKRGTRGQVAESLKNVQGKDEEIYGQIQGKDKVPENFRYSVEPYCVKIQLPKELRKRVAGATEDAAILGFLDTGVMGRLRDSMEERISLYLTRPDCDSFTHGSKAFFEQIITVLVSSTQNARLTRDLHPVVDNIKYFLNKERRGAAGSFGESSYEIRQDGSPLFWQTRDAAYDVPVECTLLYLARIRESDGFKDVYTYQRMKKNYDEITGKEEEHIENLKYYGVKPPPPGQKLWEETEQTGANSFAINGIEMPDSE